MTEQRNPIGRTRRSVEGQIRMSDVAQLAGVSPQTVSRALSRPELVTEATRLVVAEAVAKLNYIPDGAARNLASRSSGVVAVIIPMISSSIYAVQVSKIFQTLETRGLSVLIGNSEYSLLREEKLVETFLQRRPDGIILTGLQHTERTRDLLVRSGVPVVETWDNESEPIDMVVGFSNFAAGEEVGRLFLSRGAKRVAFVGGAFDQDFRAKRRFEGFESALKMGGVAVRARASLSMPLQHGDGVKGLDIVLGTDPMIDAVFFSADSLALSALLECMRRGVRIPDQLAICGFGDYELSNAVTPALTTIGIPTGQIGEAAANLILSHIEGDSPKTKNIAIDFQLKRRGSA